ncbi:hypothetical protein ACFQ60_37250 [Streptomyces zhihengii]
MDTTDRPGPRPPSPAEPTAPPSTSTSTPSARSPGSPRAGSWRWPANARSTCASM